MILNITKYVLAILVLFQITAVGIGMLDSKTIIEEDIGVISRLHLKYDLILPTLLGRTDHTIIINSHGGRADQMKLMLKDMKDSGLNFTTKVETFSASAAAVIFMAGDTRIMDKDAVLLFHGALIGGYKFTEPNLKLAKDFINDGKLESALTGTLTNVTYSDIIALDVIQTLASDPYTGIAGVRQQVLSAYEAIHTINKSILDVVAVKLAYMTEAQVSQVIFDDFKTDINIHADVALKLGIATKIEE